MHCKALDCLAEHTHAALAPPSATAATASAATTSTTTATWTTAATAAAAAVVVIGDGVAFVEGSPLGSTLLQLQCGVERGDLATRRACVRGLCRLALALPDPARFTVYAFLVELQMGRCVRARSRLMHPLQNRLCAHVSSLRRLPYFRAEGLGVADLVTPVLCYLDAVYEHEDAAATGNIVPSLFFFFFFFLNEALCITKRESHSYRCRTNFLLFALNIRCGRRPKPCTFINAGRHGYSQEHS